MAEYAHQVPEKYGDPSTVYRPRITSYHRRLWAAAGPILVDVAILFFLFYRHPGIRLTIILVIMMVIAATVAYSVLKPSIVVTTDTHVLRGRMIGWQAVERKNIERTILVERLTPKKVYQAENPKKLGGKGVPGVWALDAEGKQLMRLDGRIWDYKTLKAIATSLAPQTVSYPKINVVQMAKQHKGLITFNELHPGWRSATIAIVSAVVILFLGFGAAIPDDIWHNLPFVHQ